MDAFAVSLTAGVGLSRVGTGHTLRMAGAFGAFQFFMPVLGWLLGVKATAYIARYDHWLAFALLTFVGVRMIREAWGKGENHEEGKRTDPTRGGALLLLAVATSLDALAVGLSFALLGDTVWRPALIIGVVCFAVTAVGLHLGHMLRRAPGLKGLGDKANIFGGIVLIGIGVKILHEHGVFG